MSEAASIQPQAGAAHEPMKPRLLKGMQADYEPASWDGANTSGMIPLGKNLLIRMDECAKATSGGVLLVDDQLERMDAASTTGVVYAVGEPIPGIAPGERVWTEKYAGQIGRGADGKLYRIMDRSNLLAKQDPYYIGQDDQAGGFGA